MILLRSFLSGHIRIKRTLEYYDAGIGPRVPFGGGFGPTVSAIFATALGDYSTLSTLSSMPTGGSISRAGQAMLYDSTGKLTYAPNNLLLNSNTFNGSGWVSSPAGTSVTSGASDPLGGNNAWTITATTTNGYFYSNSSAAKLPASTVGAISSVWIRRKTGTGVIRLRTNVASVDTPITVTSTWTRVSVNVSGFDGSNDTWVMNIATNGDAVDIFQAQLEAVTYQTTPSTYVATTSAAYYGPRFDYDPATAPATPKGLLIEGTRTNLLVYSQSFASGWSQTNTAITVPNNIVSPDGTTNGGLFSPSATVNNLAFQSITTSATTAFSIYAKSNGANWIALRLFDGTTTYFTWFNLSNGTIGTNQNTSASITPVGNSWYRLSIARAGLVAGGSGNVLISASDTDGAQSVASTSNRLYIWGAQAEAGSFATSYIATAADSLARAAETFAITGYSTNLIEAFYIDEATGGSWSANYNAGTAPSTSFGWTTSLRVYTNAYAGDIATPSWIDNSGTTGNRMYTDSTGTLTWAPANWLTNSNTFSATGSWINNNLATPVQGAASWDGTNTAWTITNDATNGLHRLYQGLAANSDGIRSVYAKAGTANFMSLSASGTDGPVVNLTDGSITNAPTGGTAYAVSVGNGWWRVSWRSSGNVGFIQIFIGETASQAIPNTSYAGTGKSILIASAQHEPVTYQTSPRAYIPTTTAAIYNPRYDYDSRTYFGFTATPTNSITTSTIVIPSATWSDGSAVSTVDSYYVGQSVVINGVSYPVTAYVGSTKTLTITGLPAAVSSGILLGNPTWLQPRGMLIEESRVNTIVSSQSFSSGGWIQDGISLTANASIAPDGTNTATSIVTGTGNNRVYQFDNSGVTGSKVFSIFAKANAGSSFTIDALGGQTPGATATVNLSTQTITGFTGASIQSYGNGWFRIFLPVTVTTATGNATYWRILGPSSSVFIWGAQLEAGSFATSYIPTTTGPVTRVADIVKLSGSALTVAQANKGSVIAQTTKLYDGSSNHNVLASSATTYRYLIYNGGANTTTVAYNGSSALTATIGSSGTWTAGPVRASIGWDTIGATIVANNGTATNTVGYSIPATTDAIYVGAREPNGQVLGGWVASVALYNQRLPDTILKQKSSVNAPY